MRREPTLSLLHTAASHVDTFERLNAKIEKEGGPVVRLSHMVREDLLQRAISAGVMPEDTYARAVRILHEATASSDAVLCTCSTLGPAADEAASKGTKPVFRIDRPMARAAVREGHSIAVLATLKCTLKPTTELIEAEAREATGRADVAPVLVEWAWDAYEAGDMARMHDLIAESARLVEQAGANVIVLAQASMADALAPGAIRIPVLSSPESGLREALAGISAPA